MPKKEIEGDWILGWPDHKRPNSKFYKDTEGRVVSSRLPFLELEGLITPTDGIVRVNWLERPGEVPSPDR